MSAGMFLLLAQTLGGLPAMPAGTEVRLVSPDLLTVYASATLDGGDLAFVGVPPAGTELRLLFFPPDASAQDRAAALSGARVLSGFVSGDASDILLQLPDNPAPVSFRDLLHDDRGIRLRLLPSKGA